LRSYGVDADVDLAHQSERGIDWTRWGPQKIRASEWVLVLLSAAWRDRWQGGDDPTVGAGAAAEADELLGLYARDRQEFRDKVVVVTLPMMASQDLVPDGLRGGHRFTLRDFSFREVERLLRLLTNQPVQPLSDLMPVPDLPSAGSESLPHVEQRIGAVERALDRIPESEPDAQGARARERLAGTLSQLRREHARRSRRTDERPITRQFHGGAVTAVAFDPRGDALATASADGTVRLWSPPDGDQVACFDHPDVLRVLFHPGGELIASASEDGSVRLWNVRSQEEAGELSFIGRGVLAAAFSPDGVLLAVGHPIEPIKLWDVTLAAQLPGLDERDGRYVWALAFQPDGRLLATGTSDGFVRIWDMRSRTMKAPLAHGEAVKNVMFSRDGQWLAVIVDSAARSAGREARIWHVPSLSAEAHLELSAPTTAAALSADGQLVAIAARDGTAIVWEWAADRDEQVLPHDGPVRAVVFMDDRGTLATASDDGTVRVWDDAGSELRRLRHDAPVTDIALSADGRFLAAGCDDSAAWLWHGAAPD
jgi:WD40 repeat protein